VTVTNAVILNSLFVVGSQVTNEDVNVTVVVSLWVWLHSVWERVVLSLLALHRSDSSQFKDTDCRQHGRRRSGEVLCSSE